VQSKQLFRINLIQFTRPEAAGTATESQPFVYIGAIYNLTLKEA
jgi:hypothetical protein